MSRRWRKGGQQYVAQAQGAAGAAAEAAPQDQGRARRARAVGVRTRPARQDQAEQQVPRVGRALVPALTQRLAETSTLRRWRRPDHAVVAIVGASTRLMSLRCR